MHMCYSKAPLTIYGAYLANYNYYLVKQPGLSLPKENYNTDDFTAGTKLTI